MMTVTYFRGGRLGVRAYYHGALFTPITLSFVAARAVKLEMDNLALHRTTHILKRTSLAQLMELLNPTYATMLQRNGKYHTYPADHSVWANCWTQFAKRLLRSNEH